MFNAAFISCWTKLTSQLQNELVANLHQALCVKDIPEITQTILNLAEFMDHSEKVDLYMYIHTVIWYESIQTQGPLLIKSNILADQALQSRAYAKALRYREVKFAERVDAELLESLIRWTYVHIATVYHRTNIKWNILFSINNKLQLGEASYGLVEYAKKKSIAMVIDLVIVYFQRFFRLQYTV